MKVKTAILPAAGLGTRFLPVTKSIPKEMLPIVDKPLIQYSVEEALDAGIEQIIIITASGKSSIEDHFDISTMLEMELANRGKNELLEAEKKLSRLADIVYLRQKEALGVGHAISLAANLLKDEAFAVMFCDDIIDATPPVLTQMVQQFEKTGSPIISAMEIPEDKTHMYGIIETSSRDKRMHEIKDMIEKPPKGTSQGNLAIIGRYILTPDIVPILHEIEEDHTGEIQLTTALLQLLKKRKMYAYQFEGERFDAGSKVGFLQANINYALKREKISKTLREYLETIRKNER